jgi:heme exporter protein C
MIGMALLYVLLWEYEIAHKTTVARLRSLKRKLAGDDGLRARRSAAPELQVR